MDELTDLRENPDGSVTFKIRAAVAKRWGVIPKAA
jgi:hypothetical protein